MNRTKEFDRLAFTVLAIEASAQKMNISPSEMHISTDRALQIFYDSDVCRMLHEKDLGLHLMSDTYIVNDLIAELRNKQ
ncbi:DUF3791 domain-containing protein [Leyella stercorea]|uniref:DUF3791 domain-containing protein n=1 Tax=Leyella stercorea TaxID=363265 RepID=UPI003F7DBE22